LGDIPGYDYIIANSFTLPNKKQNEYSEKVLYLEPSYYPSDDPSEYPIVTRKELGLPEKSFVFGCAGQDYKLTPEYFTMWMQILRQVPNSVLWLYALNPILIKNLQKEAQKNGVLPERLVFFSYMKHSKYVAALKCADLMLDTQYYNANTTAADALFMGIPVLTCPQERLTSRLVGSILQTLELPELIAETPEQYEEKAVYWGTHPKELKNLKQKVAKQVKSGKFFDSQVYARKFEVLCHEMIRQYEENKKV
jgi:predicted O-linked N-acetylglucosamine transferase (SPINDLY family)